MSKATDIRMTAVRTSYEGSFIIRVGNMDTSCLTGPGLGATSS